MSERVFWDVDTQVDFVLPDGKLSVAGAENIIGNLAQLNDHAHQRGIRVIASADDHVEGHAEISATPDFAQTFPPHCLRGTPGQRRIPETTLQNPLVIEPDAALADISAHRGDILFHKHFFDVFTNPHVSAVVETLGITHAVLYGVALDVCVRFAVEGLLERYPDVSLCVVTDAVRALDESRGHALLKEWAARGVRLETTAEVIAPATC